MEKKTLFVDTGAWFALADKSDQHHKQAIDIYPKLLSNYHHLKTTNLVIAETYILIRRSIGHQPAIKFLESIATSPRVIKIYSDSVFEKKSRGYLAAISRSRFQLYRCSQFCCHETIWNYTSFLL